MSRPYTTEQIKALASLLRQALGLEAMKRLDMKAALAKFKELYPEFDYLVVSDEELSDGEAKYDPEIRCLKIAARVLKALENGSSRAAFTIAHELGHPILRHTEIRFRRAERMAYERAKPNIRREEREADQFAAFLLAPDHLAEGCRTVEDFMVRFGLSNAAAEIRKEQYDRDLRRKRGEGRSLPSNVVDFLEFQRRRGCRVTALNTEPRQRHAVAGSEASLEPAPRSRAQLGELAKSELRSGSSAVLSTHYISERCSVCGEPTLLPLDCKYKCDTCHTVIDRFQDGDIVDP